MGKATIIDIARRAGVGVGTASRALNNAPDVSPATRERVLKAASELNYQPDAVARRLQGRRTNVVAYVPEVGEQPAGDMHFKDFIAILALSCARHGLDLLIHPLHNRQDHQEAFRKLLVGRRADGLILADTRLSDERVAFLAGEGLPFVAFGRTDSAHDYAYVDLDSEAGTSAAVGHLVERGHRRIAYLGLPTGYTFARHRLDGYRRGMAEAGLATDEALIAAELTNETETRARVRELLLAPTPPSAFVAATDLLAIAAMREAEELGLAPGRDLALVGFDDLPLAAHTRPSLSTVRQRFDYICDLLIGTLVGVIGQDPAAERQSLVQPELIVRQSSDFNLGG